MLLSLENLAVDLPSGGGFRRVVRGVSFAVAEGQSLGLVGESGSGAIRFEGRDLLALGEAEMLRLRGDRVAMVFQEPMTALNPLIPVGAQIAEPLRLHRGFSRARAAAEAVRLIARVRLRDPEKLARAHPFQLSGGERQRAMIAMALACRPKLLIADEPTTALDVTVQAEILELLAEMKARLGMAILLITHDMGVVAEHAQRVAVRYAGIVVEEAPVGELFANPRHPYTQGLIRSIPRPDRDAGRRTRLEQIPGTVPSLLRPP